MSLIAWYPLNGDTKDYSGNNFHLTNNGATVDTSGKIGSCYNFVSLKPMNYIGWILPQGTIWKDFTVSAWIYPTETPTQHGYNVLSFNRNAMIRFRLTTNNLLWVLWGGETDSDYANCESNGKIPLNTWTHVACRLNNGIMSLYINGRLDKTHNTQKDIKIIGNTLYVGAHNPSDATESWRGKLNDVRIYNEALTAKQIKEISQAKICHYTFNEEMYENTINLYNNKNQLSPRWTKIEWENTYALSFEIAKDSYYDGIFFTTNLTLKPLTIYTLSYKFKKLAGKLQQIRGHVNPDIFEDLGVILNNKKYDSYSNAISITDCDDVYEIQFKFRTKENVTNMHDIYIQPNVTVSDYVKVKVWDIQVEEKDHATPFTPNTRTQKLKDISGYNHHMTTYTEYSPVWKQDNSDIRIKGYSTLSDKASYYCENFKYKYPDAFTFSCWIKTTDSEAFCVLGFPNGNNANMSMAIKGGMLSLHSYGASPNANSDQWYATSKKAVNDNIWHLLTIVYDGTTAKSYIDGKYETSSTVTFNFQRHPAQHLSINMTSPTSNFGDYEKRRFNGNISDVRIYATALSDEDVKLLYQPEINIDKSNVIRCSEINEKEMEISESIKIVSAGYGVNQGKYKVSIGDKYSTTERAIGWCVTSIDINKNITHKTFKTHDAYSVFVTLKQYVDSLPITSTILLSTYDQPSVYTTNANNHENCKSWISYLRSLGSTQIDNTFKSRAAYAAIIQERKIVAEDIHNTNTDSMVTLEKIVNLKVNKQGFNNNASITYNEFNEVPNIKSGVHNLKLGNETLPVLIDMDNDGGRWARVFYHNCKSGTVLFSGDNSYAEAKETNKNAPTTSDKYSILSKLECFRPNIKSAFEFRLTYPTDTNSGLNKWTMKQYSKQLSSANAYPLLSDIQGLSPTLSTVIDDTKDFIPNDVGDYYIRHYKTKVYCNIAKTISFQMRNDDSVTIYVNSNIAVQRVTISTFSDVRLSLNKGWNTLEILYYEHTFNDYFLLNKKISDLVDILDYNGSYNDCNIWKQTSNPTHQKVTGYKSIKIKWTSDFWGGLEYSGGSTFIDGSVNHDYWFYAIGTSDKYEQGMPSGTDVARNSNSTANDVELWIRINNYDLFADNSINNVSISRDGVLTAKEFREI